MRLLGICAVAVLALAGCGQAGTAMSDEEVAGELAKMPALWPGRYSTQISLVSLEAPHAAPEKLEAMRASMEKKARGGEHCLGPEKAKQGYRREIDKLTGRDRCKFHSLSVSGGRIDAKMFCSQGFFAGSATIDLSGTVSPSSLNMTMLLKQSGGLGPTADMTLEMKLANRMIGEC